MQTQTVRTATAPVAPPVLPSRPIEPILVEAPAKQLSRVGPPPRFWPMGTESVIDTVLAHRTKVHSGVKLVPNELCNFTKPTQNNQMQLLLDRDYFDVLFPAMAGARDSIHLAMLTFDVSPLGQAVTDLLLEKKRQNPTIAIRVILDTYGSEALMPWSAVRRNVAKMRAAGIDVVCNNVFRTGLEHRKIMVVDGERGFIGGASFGKEYYASAGWWKKFNAVVQMQPEQAAAYFRHKYDPQAPVCDNLLRLDDVTDLPQYHDFGFACSGEMVRDLQASFLQTWLYHGQTIDPGMPSPKVRGRYFPVLNVATGSQSTSTCPVKMNHSVPGGVSEMGTSLAEVVRAARDTLDLTFAYILVPAFVDELVAAAKRGVKVRILVPSEEGIDLKACYFTFRKHYERLMAAGDVRIYEFSQYTHLKLMVADHHLIFTSTGNPEWDSWERAFDEIAIIDSPALAKDIETRVYDVDLASSRSEQVTPEQVRNTSWWNRIQIGVYHWVFETFFRVRPNQTQPMLTMWDREA